jgi:formylglycine-generating enzyme required for sulfatase activity
MGSPHTDRPAPSHEKPQHRIRITTSFYLGACEVTRGQFRQFVEHSGYKTDADKALPRGITVYDGATKKYGFAPEGSWRNVGFQQTDEHPVVGVNWNDVTAFCQWIGRKEGKTYRLPTEAEWEYACRAGTTTRFVFDEATELLDAYAWHDKNCGGMTHPVGQKKPNGWGLYDMHGNVWEWCPDGYDAAYYGGSPVIDPMGAATALNRVTRGGGWKDPDDNCRSAHRFGHVPGGRSTFLGFRVVAQVQSDR